MRSKGRIECVYDCVVTVSTLHSNGVKSGVKKVVKGERKVVFENWTLPNPL